ncbi:hypothetical protein P3L10_016094 [Capsicum annuum]
MGIDPGLSFNVDINFTLPSDGLVDSFRPWMQEDHVMIVILMTVINFVANCLENSFMMM